MARKPKPLEVSDGLPAAEVPAPGGPCVVVELVDQARAVLAGESEAYGERNTAAPTDAFRERVFREWFVNNTGKIEAAFRKDVLG